MTDCNKCPLIRAGVTCIQCDKCDEWTHLTCANLTTSQADRIVNYFCDNCEDDTHLTSWRKTRPSREQRIMKAKFYYDVQSIKDHRGDELDREFLVEWKDCPVEKGSDDNVCTWEPERNLDGCIDLLQGYCRKNEIALSEIEGLLGADSSENGHQIKNWITMDTLLNKFAKLRSRKKVKSTLPASEWTGFGNRDQLFFLRHDRHCYALLYTIERNLAFIADGANLFRTDQQVATQLKQLLNIRLVSLEFNQQLRVDHCGSSAILIGLELLKMHSRGIKFQELIASKSWRADLIKSLHKSSSKPMKLPPLGQRRKKLTCKFCDKTFKSTQGRALSAHITKRHKQF